MNTPTVPTFAEIVATLTAEQDALLVSMDKALARKNIAKYEVLHARFTELGVAFDALWHHKEAVRKAQYQPAAAAAPAEQTMPSSAQSELFELRNIIGLCSFAAEARRVLEEIDHVANMCPEVGATLNQLISTRRNWRELGNHASDVLNDARERLNILLDDTP